MRLNKAMIATVFITSLSTNSAFAEYTLGIGASSQNLIIESDASIPAFNLLPGENKVDDTALNFFVDIYHGSFRLNGTISISVYDDFALAILTGSADYLIPLDESLNLFAGATFGTAAQAYETNTTIPNTNNNVANSPVLGYQLGAIMKLTDSLTLELGYNVRYMSLETEFFNFPVNYSTEITEVSHAYLNLGILFD